MVDPRFFDEFTDRLMGFLPPGAAAMKEDFEKNVRATLQTTFSRMDLVTREEFEVQAAVLLRTREKLEQLEERVRELEATRSVVPDSDQGPI